MTEAASESSQLKDSTLSLSNNDSAETSAPKRRGRPRKAEENTTSETANEPKVAAAPKQAEPRSENSTENNASNAQDSDNRYDNSRQDNQRHDRNNKGRDNRRNNNNKQQRGGGARHNKREAGLPDINPNDPIETGFPDDMDSKNVLYSKDLRLLPMKELWEMAEEAGVENITGMLKPDVIFNLLKALATQGTIVAEGTLETLKDGYGFLRYQEVNYRTGPDDVYVPPHLIRRFGLRTGDTIQGEVRAPKPGEHYFALSRIYTINGDSVESVRRKINFDNLVPLYPDERLRMEFGEGEKKYISNRVVDLVSPLGKGQRALIVAPPRSGKTVLLQSIAQAIEVNHPEVTLMVLLIDERPEEVTDMQRSVKGEVVSSTFDEPAQRHVQLAEMLIEKARRLVEHGKDVVILLDSITRLARAYNAVVPSSGKVLTGGVDANALQRPKRFFGAARNIEKGGSLTIIGTALVETGSRMDEVIFEEFKGTGNSEIVLDRKLADKRIFPAIDITKSGTRHEEQLYDKDEMQKVWVLRRIVDPMGGVDGMEFLLEKLRRTKTNDEFFDTMNK